MPDRCEVLYAVDGTTKLVVLEAPRISQQVFRDAAPDRKGRRMALFVLCDEDGNRFEEHWFASFYYAHTKVIP